MQSWCLERKRTLLKMPILGTLLAFLVPPGMAALSTAYRLEQQSPVISKQDPRSQRGEKKKMCYFVFDLCCMTRHVHPRSPLSRSTHLRTDQHLGKKVLILECGCVCVCVTCLIRGPTLTAHTAILLLGRQGFQDNVGGSEARQRDVTQVGERVFFRK